MASEYDSLLQETPQASEYDTLLEPEPKQGGIVQSIVSEAKSLAGQAIHAVNPINLVRGVLDIQPRSGLQEVLRTGRMLRDIVGGAGIGETIRKEAPEVAQQQEAILGRYGPEAQRETLSGIGTQLGMVAAPFIHGKVIPARPEIPKNLTEVVKGVEEPITPEVVEPTTQTELRTDYNKAASDLGFEEIPATEPIAQPVPEAVAPVTAEPQMVQSRQSQSIGDVPVTVDVSKLDAAHGAAFPTERVGEGGEGGIAGRYERFNKFLEEGKPIEMPELNLDANGNPQFINGRHRFAALRDRGDGTVQVSVPKDQAADFQSKFGETTKETPPVSVPTETTTAQPLPKTTTEEVIPSAIEEGKITENVSVQRPGDGEGGTPAETSGSGGVQPEAEVVGQERTVDQRAGQIWDEMTPEERFNHMAGMDPFTVVMNRKQVVTSSKLPWSEVKGGSKDILANTLLYPSAEHARAAEARLTPSVPSASEATTAPLPPKETAPVPQPEPTVPTPAETQAVKEAEQVGIAAKYREDELGPGSVIPGVGKTPDQARAFGHDYINKGGNPYDAINQKGPKRELWQDVGIARAEHERLGIEKRNAEAALEANPNDPQAQMAFDNADLAQRQWSKDVQPVLTRAGDALRAASRSYPREISTFSDFTDIVNDHFKGEVELNPLQRAELQKAVKAIKKGNLEATDVRARVTNEVVKKANGKVMDFDSLKTDLRGTMEQLLKDCVL